MAERSVVTTKSNLEEQFESATIHLEKIVSSLNDDKKLYFYSRFKQAKEGTCNTAKPSMFNLAARRKWTSWSSLGDMSRDQAMQEYIQEIQLLDPEWVPKEKGEEEKPLSLGLSVSIPKRDPNDFIDDNNKTFLDWVKEGSAENVERLLKISSCISNECDDEGMSALHWACDRGHKNIVEILLNYGVDINQKDAEGQTPLHYASFCGHVGTIEILLKSGADNSLLDNDGQRPSDVACDKNIEDYLLKS